MKKLRIPIVVVVGLAALFLVVRRSEALPTITWSPPSFAPEVIVGESTSTVIFFTSSQKLSDVTVQVSRELEGLLTVTPTTIDAVPAEKLIHLTLTMSPPAGSLPRVVQGAIAIRGNPIRVNPVYSPPLAVIMNIKWPITSAGGVSITYPGTWQINEGEIDQEDTLEITNFHGQYLHGGIVPAGGAVLTIPGLPLPSSLAQLIADDTSGDEVVSQEQVTVDETAATKVTSKIRLGPDLTYKRIVYYVPRSEHLYKIILDYRLNDPGESDFLSALSQVIVTADLDQ